jgi:hypothetical protein
MDGQGSEMIPMVESKQMRVRHTFSAAEDELLLALVSTTGANDWAAIAQHFTGRNARQVRERYTCYLSPSVKDAEWTQEEDDLLMRKYSELGRKWVKLAEFFPCRTDSMLKNRFNLLERHRRRAGGLDWGSTSSPELPDKVRLPGIESFECPFLFPSDFVAAPPLAEVPLAPISYLRVACWM